MRAIEKKVEEADLVVASLMPLGTKTVEVGTRFLTNRKTLGFLTVEWILEDETPDGEDPNSIINMCIVASIEGTKQWCIVPGILIDLSVGSAYFDEETIFFPAQPKAPLIPSY